MAGKVKTICEEKINPIIESLGYEVVEVEYVKKSDGMNLTFYIDSENGVNIEDCEKVSRAIDEPLEEVNPTDDQPYILSVSSPGIDRPLKSERDYKRNIGKDVIVTTFAKIDGNKKFDGTLSGFNENEIELTINDKVMIIKKEQIAHIVPNIKF